MTETNKPVPVRVASTSPMADAARPPRPQDAKGRFLPKDVAPAAAPMPSEEPVASTPRARQRKPFGRQEAKLAYPGREGFQRRWFNDVHGRIPRAKDAGYEHVLDDKGTPVTFIVGTQERGGGLTAFLMEIPQEFYDADFALKQAALDETDKAIYRGQLNEEPGDNRYVPRSAPIKFGVTRGTGKG